jgi:hypothetical protein
VNGRWERHRGRRSHGLTYISCQEHDSRVSAHRRISPNLSAISGNFGGASQGRFLLALKAIRPRLAERWRTQGRHTPSVRERANHRPGMRGWWTGRMG